MDADGESTSDEEDDVADMGKEEARGREEEEEEKAGNNEVDKDAARSYAPVKRADKINSKPVKSNAKSKPQINTKAMINENKNMNKKF